MRLFTAGFLCTLLLATSACTTGSNDDVYVTESGIPISGKHLANFDPASYSRRTLVPITIANRETYVNIGVKGRVLSVHSSITAPPWWTKPLALQALVQVYPRMAAMCGKNEKPASLERSIFVNERFFNGTFLCVKPNETPGKVFQQEVEKIITAPRGVRPNQQ